MQINESNFNITTYQNDWGIPVIFEARTEDGFALGDELAIIFNDSRIADRTGILITNDAFTFEFKLAEAEASGLFDGTIRNQLSIPYSVKRARDGQYLETLVNAYLIVKGTVLWRD